MFQSNGKLVVLLDTASQHCVKIRTSHAQDDGVVLKSSVADLNVHIMLHQTFGFLLCPSFPFKVIDVHGYTTTESELGFSSTSYPCFTCRFECVPRHRFLNLVITGNTYGWSVDLMAKQQGLDEKISFLSSFSEMNTCKEGVLLKNNTRYRTMNQSRK